MTAILSGATIFKDLNGSNTFSGAVVVPAACTLAICAPILLPAGTVASRSITTLTLNGVTFVVRAGSRVTSTDGTFTSGEIWALPLPATGSHTFVGTANNTCRGGFFLAFVQGNTGFGVTNGAQDSVVALNGAGSLLDSSLILSFFGFQPSGTPSLVPTALGPLQNNGLITTSASTRAMVASTMRGYHEHPACMSDGSAGRGNVAVALEVLS